jgi:carbon-monoxide dehydrogenase medium subunit
VIPAEFDYAEATSVDEALGLLRDGGPDAEALAGGHSLLPMMKLRLATPSVLVDLGGIRELSYIRADGDQIAIGAMTRHNDIERSSTLRESCGLVAHVASLVGDPQVRHRGTIGGSVAHADPAGDLPSALLALDADMVVAGPSGQRTVPAGEFFTGLFETAVGDDELLTEIRVPTLDGRGWHYVKMHQRAIDWAIVGVAAVVGRSDGQIDDARVGLTSMGTTPLRARAVEQALAGQGTDAIDEAARVAADGTDPPSDARASGEFRAHLARVLTSRALHAAGGG